MWCARRRGVTKQSCELFCSREYRPKKPSYWRRLICLSNYFKRKSACLYWQTLSCGAPEGTRTPDLLVRSQSLYPAELRAHMLFRTQEIYYHIFLCLSRAFANFLIVFIRAPYYRKAPPPSRSLYLQYGY